MKEKYRHSSDDGIGQSSFFNLGSLPSSETLYNRIVLNLTELPKTNPHHYLVQQILAQKLLMKRDAIVYVFTNQKLFVPSHSDRVEQLLKDFKVEVQINMEELKGKGEIAHYAYVLTRRTKEPIQDKHLFEVNRKIKESCLSFEFRGDLTRFNKFNKFVEELQRFMKMKNPVTTPVFASEIDPNLHFEFHQDAIMDGKLVSSVVQNDANNLAHPRFFNNLTKSSTSLNTFFNIDLITHADQHSVSSSKNISNGLLGINLGPEKQFPLLLIVNQYDPMNVKIELTTIDSYLGKLEQYGSSFYYYFGISPKHPLMNLNVFREYFNSLLGHQVIQLQLSDGPTKLKAKLKSLLVPNFFASTQQMQLKEKNYFNLLDMEVDELKNLHPDELVSKFQTLKMHFNTYSKTYPWHLLGLLSHFKLQLNSFGETLIEKKHQSFNFSNPLISDELVKLKSYSIYPNNEEVYIDFKINSNLELQHPMTSLAVINNEELSILSLRSNEKEIIQLHASPIMIHFIKFILQNASGVKIADILLNLKVPKNLDLMDSAGKFENLRKTNAVILKDTEDLISIILRTEVSR
jgi:hypothetical protein